MNVFVRFFRSFQWFPKIGLTFSAAAIFLSLQMLATSFEGVGIAMLLPIFEFIKHGNDVGLLESKGAYWQYIIQLFNALSVDLNVGGLILLSFTSVIVCQVFSYLTLSYKAHVRQKMMHDNRVTAFQAYLRARLDGVESFDSGRITNILTTELQAANAAVFDGLWWIGCVMMVVFYGSALASISFLISLLVVGVFLLTGLAISFLYRKAYVISGRVTHANGELSTCLLERLRALRSIRLSGMEEAEDGQFQKISFRQTKLTIRQQKNTAWIKISAEPVIIGISFLILYIGLEVISLPIEVLGLYMIILTRVTPIIQEVFGQFQKVLSKLASIEALGNLIADLRTLQEPEGGRRVFGRPSSEIRFENVSFHYSSSPDKSALRNVSLAIPAGQLTAIVGPSGSGKSTLIDLLPRLREPSEGAITVDGVQLQEFSVSSLRSSIAYVSQSTDLFNASVAKNITYGCADVSPAELRRAAELAGALSFIEALPEGFETVLGEGGAGLSGGQRQRLALARALIRCAPIMILDEPTSSLDAEAEAAFQHALDVMRRELSATVIVIAHRLATIENANAIAVLQDGRLVAHGSHQTLMAEGGWYAHAFSAQQKSSQGTATVS